MYAIKTTNLTKKYKDKTAVNSLNLTVNKGELYALLGVNGAGKSTTIKMLSCLIPPTSGDALLLDNSIVSDSAKVKQLINVSPQETAVAEKLSVRENLELVARIYGADRKTAKSKVDDMIEKFDMHEIVNSRAKTLSGGWQRRLSIAMALISEPEILFLDEPTLGLDILSSAAIIDFMKKERGRGKTILYSTHYMEEAEYLCDRILMIHRGKIVSEGSPEGLKEQTGKENLRDVFAELIKKEGIADEH